MSTDSDTRHPAAGGDAFGALVHRVNNLLGTIEVQADVADADGSLEAHRQALRYIAESAARTRRELRDLLAARAAEER